MSTLTEGLIISDIVKNEADMQRSRESLLVDASQTLVRGQVVQKGVGDRIKAIGVLVNEVQTSAEAGASAGVYRLGIPQEDDSVDYTTQLAFGADASAVNTAIAATGLGASQIVATGTDIGAFAFTFSGTKVRGKTWPLIEIQGDAAFNATTHGMTRTTTGGHAVAQTNEVQTNTSTGTSTDGTFVLSFPHWNGTTLNTAAIDHDASGATIQTAVNVALAAASPVVAAAAVAVAGTNLDGDDIVITYSGEHYEGRDWPLATLDMTLMVGMTAASFVETTKGSAGGVGSSEAIGIVLNAVTTAGGVLTTKETVLVRDAVVDEDQLTFGANANKVDVIAQLKKVGIIMRSEPVTTSA